MRRPDRSGDLHRVRDSRLSLGEGDLGGVRPVRGRAHRRVPPRPHARVGVLCAASRRPRDAPSRTLGTTRSRGSRRRGLVRAVVTQNVDGLHARAGSREIVEVHGSLREAECIQCGVRVPMAQAVAQLPLPPCPECGEILKPGVVMFGEMLPAAAIERAQQLAAEAGLLLVVGSSLEVIPSPACPRRRSPRAAPSRSSIAARRRGTRTRTSLSTAGRGRRSARWRLSSWHRAEEEEMGERKAGSVEPSGRPERRRDPELAEAPGADKVLQAFKGLADKVDDLQRRTKGYEQLETGSPRSRRRSQASRAARPKRPKRRAAATPTRASSSPPTTSVGVWKPASSRSTAEATSPCRERRPRARPRGRKHDRDERAPKRVPARPRRVERCDVDAAAVESGARQEVAERELETDAPSQAATHRVRAASTLPPRRARRRSPPARAA